jgi:hypothetical protein
MSGTTAYPGGIDSFGSVADTVDIIADDHVNDLRRAVEAIETALGANAATVLATALAAAKTGVAAQMFLSAGAAVPKTTAGCAAAAQTELSTNKQNFLTLDFDTTTEEHADFTFAMPSDYGGGTMTAQVFWTHAATTCDFGVTWGIAGRCYANDAALDQAPGTEVLVSDVGGTTTDMYISAATAAITWAGTPAAGQLINLTIARKTADAGDTMAVDAKLIGVQLNYTRA